MTLEIFGTSTWNTLLGGAIGGLIVLILTIIYQEWKYRRDNQIQLAKDRLEKVYGPLLLIFEANKDLDNSGEEHFMFTGKVSKTENEYSEETEIDQILLKNYYLIEDVRKKILMDLYSYRKYHMSKEKATEVIKVIKDGYSKNMKTAEVK